MIGYPKTLNSKVDYEFVRKNFSREKWEPAFRALLDERQEWFNVGEINPIDGINDATHKVVQSESNEKLTYYQFELRDNPYAMLYKLGFTVPEIEAILAK